MLAKCRIQIEGIAIDEVDAWIASEKLIVEIGRIFDGRQALRLDAACQNGLGDDTGAGAEFENGQVGMRVDDTRHFSCRDGGCRNDGSDLFRLADHAFEKADFFLKFSFKALLQVECHNSPRMYFGHCQKNVTHC